MDIPQNNDEYFAEVDRINKNSNLLLDECEHIQGCGKTGFALYKSAEQLFIKSQSKCTALAESIAAEINRIDNDSKSQECWPLD